MAIAEITREELTNGYDHFLTVGALKEVLNKYNLPDTAKVVIQRVEDIYYEKHNWGVYLKEGEHAFKNNDGTFEKSSLEQYHPAWSCVKYNDEDEILFINMHY